jgi:Mg-chelatase subunit ChlD
MTSRMAAIQSAARGYLQRLRDANPGQRVSIVGFSDAAHLYHRLAPVGPAFGGLCQALGALHPQSTTNLCAGLALALDQLARGRVRLGHVVIITDGGANVGQGRLPGLLNRARAAHVRIFTIGVGNNADPDYDRRLLVKIASDTRARFASADSFGQLCQALSRVA